MLLAEEEPLTNKFRDFEIKSLVAKRLQAMLFLMSRVPHDTRTRGTEGARSPRSLLPAPLRVSLGAVREKLLGKSSGAGRSGSAGGFFPSTLTHPVLSPPTPPAGLFTLL